MVSSILYLRTPYHSEKHAKTILFWRVFCCIIVLTKNQPNRKALLMNPITQVILTILGSSGLFTLIQYLIQRHDTRNDELEKFRKEYTEGLDDRERRGLQRYQEHQESIKKLNEAIVQLTKNDTEMQEYMHCVGNELMGLAHDRLVHLTDKYQERGAITLKEIATLKAIYEPYHNGLNGNGDGQAGYEFAMTLPVVTDEQAREMDKNLRR